MDQQKLEFALSKMVPPNKVRESLLDNEFMSDVTFILGKEGTPLNAHKIFLMTSSSIIYKLLTKNTEQPLNIEIKEITKPIMLEVCRYAYTDEVTLKTENMLELFKAASRFKMKILTEKTVDYICKHMNEKTVFKILEANQTRNNIRINMKCFEYIEKNFQLCLDSPDLLKVSKELLQTVLTTCKISSKSAMAVIKKWTKVNGTDDFDELLGIVVLKDFSDESETEEVPKSESANLSSSRTREPKITKSRSDNPKRNQVNISTPLPINPPFPGINIFKLYGNSVEKAYKYANLDVVIGCKNIFLRSIHFIYDLKTTDNEFEISVIEVEDNRRTTLYKDKVLFSSRTKGPFTYFDFMQKVELQAGKKIWFRIEYPKQINRITYDKFHVLTASTEDDIILRTENNYNNYAEVIGAIYYTLS